MASRTKAKRRAPLIESDTEEALRKRGAELIGLILLLLSVLAFTLIWTYSPDDPSLFSATDAPPQNALGLIGAFIADPLHRAIGWAAFGVPLALGVWGVRMLLHAGDNRVLTRNIATPIAILVGAAFASTHVPGAAWPHDYGLGGLLGDAVSSELVAAIPLPVEHALLVASLVLAVLLVLTGGFALGINRFETLVLMDYLRQGAIVVSVAVRSFLRMVWMTALKLTGHAVDGAAKGARSAQSYAAERRARRLEAAESEPEVVAKPRRAEPKPEPEVRDEDEAEDSIMAKITAAVKARAEADAAGRVARSRTIPPLTSDEADDDDDVIEHAEPVMRATPPAPAAEPRVQKSRTTKLRKSAKARSEEQPELFGKGDAAEYEEPGLSLLESPDAIERHLLSDEALEENARMLETVLDDYGVRGDIVSIRPGPVVTMYELEPAAGLKASRVMGLSDDIARSMSALACRVSTIPGRSVIGIELPNEMREKVLLREILSAKQYGDSPHSLPLALGKDIGGEPVVANLARMPHLLIAGTTGSGKSVAVNTMILSLLYKLGPKDCRLIMIDPKMLELSVYDGIPHLLSPVVTDPKKAVVALKWTVAEMEERYRKMSKMGVRNIDGYNQRVRDALAKGEDFTRTVQTGFDEDTGEPIFETEEFTPETMPFIVVIVDEMADLMMVAGKEIEACIQRLAQMARASGIHLIMATQRPSVDVITGTIKANFPTRISFQVTSKIDSRTILGEMGAEQLLGMGDMLYMAGGGRITRVHGPFVSDEEVEDVVRHLKELGPPEYDSGVVDGPEAEQQSEIDAVLGLGGNTNGEDALYDQAVAIVAQDRKCSTSYIQRKLSIGYNKAAKLVEQMEDEGVVSQANHVGKREVLIPER